MFRSFLLKTIRARRLTLLAAALLLSALVLQRRFTWCIHFLRLVCIWRDIAPAIQPQVAGDHTGSISRPFPQSVVVVLVAIPASGAALAQSPPPDTDSVILVNRDRQMVERKKEGDFVARPILSRQTDVLFYAIRHPDTGDWLTSTYRVRGGEKHLSEGWEYTFEYPALDEQPELHPEQGYLLVLAVPRIGGGDHHVFHALIPVHQPNGLWDKVLGALDPDRWAKAGAKWVIQGVHGTLCGVVQQVSASDLDECRGG